MCLQEICETALSLTNNSILIHHVIRFIADKSKAITDCVVKNKIPWNVKRFKHFCSIPSVTFERYISRLLNILLDGSSFLRFRAATSWLAAHSPPPDG